MKKESGKVYYNNGAIYKSKWRHENISLFIVNDNTQPVDENKDQISHWTVTIRESTKFLRLCTD